jgi:serine protease Do
MSRRKVVGAVGMLVVAGALLLTTRGSADRPRRDLASGVLRVENRNCGHTMLGSGFLVDGRHLVTAAHVVDSAGSIALRRDGRVVARGELVGTDSAADLALIRLDRPVDGHAFALSKRAPERGERVTAVGYPRDAPLVQAHGSVLGTATTVPAPGVAHRSLVQTDAVVSPGESGGPLLAGRTVAGMIDLSSAQGTGQPSFAVSARDAAPLVARWRSDPEAVPQRPCSVASGYPTLPQPSPRSVAASPPPAHM